MTLQEKLELWQKVLGSRASHWDHPPLWGQDAGKGIRNQTTFIRAAELQKMEVSEGEALDYCLRHSGGLPEREVEGLVHRRYSRPCTDTYRFIEGNNTMSKQDWYNQPYRKPKYRMDPVFNHVPFSQRRVAVKASIGSKKASIRTVQELCEAIGGNEQIARHTAAVREVYGREGKSEDYDRIKKKSVVCIPTGHLRDGRHLDDNIEHNGLYVFEMDGLATDQCYELADELRKHPDFAMAALSLSGHGLWWLLNGPTARNKEDYVHWWRRLSDTHGTMQERYGLIDKSCKNLGRLRYLAHSPVWLPDMKEVPTLDAARPEAQPKKKRISQPSILAGDKKQKKKWKIPYITHVWPGSKLSNRIEAALLAKVDMEYAT